jgi:hypothetical protein
MPRSNQAEMIDDRRQNAALVGHGLRRTQVLYDVMTLRRLPNRISGSSVGFSSATAELSSIHGQIRPRIRSGSALGALAVGPGGQMGLHLRYVPSPPGVEWLSARRGR